MGFKEFQKNLPVFSISVVTKITQLSARQIRYYEEKKLFTPNRTEGNTRLFSLHLQYASAFSPINFPLKIYKYSPCSCIYSATLVGTK